MRSFKVFFLLSFGLGCPAQPGFNLQCALDQEILSTCQPPDKAQTCVGYSHYQTEATEGNKSYCLLYTSLEIHNEIARPGLSSLSSLDSRGQLGAQPSGLARPGWFDPCPGRPGWLDLETLGASGSPWMARSGFEWLDLGALGALAGSLWTPWALLARPGWPTTAPSTRLAKKDRFAFRRSCFDAACFVRSGTFLHASKLVVRYTYAQCASLFTYILHIPHMFHR